MARFLTSVAVALAAGAAIAPAAHATYPGREGRIAFAPGSLNSPGQALFSIKPDGSDRRTIAANAHVARWSADGQVLAYSTFEAIDVARPDGSEARRVVDLAGPFALSPDGKTIVATRALPANEDNWGIRGDLVAIDVATGQERLVTYDAAQPVFSPDGKRLAFIDESRSRYRYIGIGTVGLDGKGRRFIYRGGGESTVESLDWSPTGATIAFVQRAGRRATDLRLVGVRSGRVKRLLRRDGGRAGLYGGLSWSPTGKRIAVGGWDGNRHYELLAVTLGGRVTKIGRKGQLPSWQPVRR